jgi:hypothetical protein
MAGFSAYLLRMRRTAFQPWACVRAAIVVSLAVLGWFVPAQSFASCGDYVTMVPHTTPAQQGSPPPVTGSPAPSHDAISQVHEQMLGTQEFAQPAPCRRCPSRPTQPGKPCQGPWCSNQNSPLSVPPSTSPAPRDDNGVCAPTAQPSDSEAISHDLATNRAARVHHVFPIDHPPKTRRS